MAKLIELQKLGQSLWYDNISRDLIQNGTIKKLVDEGVSGMTSNPAIFEKAINGSDVYDQQIREAASQGKTPIEIYELLAVDDIRAAADILRPVFDKTNGADGYVSLEVSPFLAHDTKGTIAEAHRLFEWVGRPNLMIKIPATPAGIPAVEECLSAGLNINITLIFSRNAYAQVMEAYISALEHRQKAGKPINTIASVASFFVSRVDSLVDKMLDQKINGASDSASLKALQGKAAIANAKLAYDLFETTFGAARFEELKKNGARVQRPLWASTSTKNPAYRDVIYVEELIGPDTVNTAPPQTIDSFRDHGVAELTLRSGVEDARRLEEQLEAAGIAMDDVTSQLLDEAVRLFADPFQKLLDTIEVKRREYSSAASV
jgi:transaldolase